MKLLRYLLVAAIGLAVAATTDRAVANDPYVSQQFHGNAPPTLGQAVMQSHKPTPAFQRLHQFFANVHRPNLPVFQAAPWYNYWPYDGHFLTPAPISGQFYGPPMTGNFPVNPYFPGPAIPTGGFGMIPGGPPPMMMQPGR
jgi:hypothetical protein